LRFRLTPRDATFFDLLATSAGHLVKGADLLAQLIGAPPAERASYAEELKKVEHEADDSTHAIMRRLNQTFVTPFDRDDIYNLASTLDDCMDNMEAAGDLIVLYRVHDLPEGVTDQVSILQRSAELTAGAMPQLAHIGDELTEYWIEINRLENEADRSYRELLALLFQSPRYQESPAAVIEMFKLKGIIDVLEQAADSFETVANYVETISVKES